MRLVSYTLVVSPPVLACILVTVDPVFLAVLGRNNSHTLLAVSLHVSVRFRWQFDPSSGVGTIQVLRIRDADVQGIYITGGIFLYPDM